MEHTDKIWWEKGLKKAMDYWRSWLTRQDVKDMLMEDGIELDKPFKLRSYFLPLIGDKKEVNIADIGAGAINLLGNTLLDVKINLFPSDIMADEFNILLKEINITPVIPVLKQDMENLTYEDNFFDIVHCSNALDHCVNPLKVIDEMIRVCKPGGYVYLRHARNEGRREKYLNLHHWNLHEYPNGDCILWQKDRTNDILLQSIYPKLHTEYKKDWEGWDCKNITRLISIYKKPINN